MYSQKQFFLCLKIFIINIVHIMLSIFSINQIEFIWTSNQTFKINNDLIMLLTPLWYYKSTSIYNQLLFIAHSL